jgi:cytochrome c-type biogenesis protein CcmH/NrfF
VTRALRTTLLVAAATAMLGAAAPEPKTTLPDVEDEVMCPICGTALNLSGAPQADRERAFIRRQIAAGKTKEEIKDALVAQYGTEVLAEPRKSGFELTAWLVPVAAILVAAGRIRQRRGSAAPRWKVAARARGGRAARSRSGSLRPLTRPRTLCPTRQALPERVRTRTSPWSTTSSTVSRSRRSRGLVIDRGGILEPGVDGARRAQRR